jgi:hypothetical protein
LKITVVDKDPSKVGRRFSNSVVELALASYPGFTLTTPPGRENPMLEYWPSLIEQRRSLVVIGDRTVEIEAITESDQLPGYRDPTPGHGPDDLGPAVEVPIGRLVGARSGDKGGNANLGVWARSDLAYEWLTGFLTVERLQQLIPESAALEVRRYLLPNLRAINFVLHGYLGHGVSSSNRLDPQAKALGEYFRARVVEIPQTLLAV